MWPMSLLFIKTTTVKQSSYENDFSGVFDALLQIFLCLYLCLYILLWVCGLKRLINLYSLVGEKVDIQQFRNILKFSIAVGIVVTKYFEILPVQCCAKYSR